MSEPAQGRFPTVTTERIKSLNDQLNDSTLKSSTRILILILLSMNGRLSSVELRALTGLGKGSLENHLEKLEAAGYVKVGKVRSFSGSGWRQQVEVTPKGLQGCKALLETIRDLRL